MQTCIDNENIKIIILQILYYNREIYSKYYCRHFESVESVYYNEFVDSQIRSNRTWNPNLDLESGFGYVINKHTLR